MQSGPLAIPGAQLPEHTSAFIPVKLYTGTQINTGLQDTTGPFCVKTFWICYLTQKAQNNVVSEFW